MRPGKVGRVPPPVPGRHLMTDKLIRLAAGAPLACRPGTAMLYSTSATNCSATSSDGLASQPFWQFAQSRLFEPLGMRDSQFVLPPSLRERRVYRAPGMPGTDSTSLDARESTPLSWTKRTADLPV